ncbi:MAG: DUF4147 domain-containing protein [Candidatus Riflebacteria bacterium]|nr:DUF4147 domain-containing protein [Candidatus Riflebacteria bacterium]
MTARIPTTWWQYFFNRLRRTIDPVPLLKQAMEGISCDRPLQAIVSGKVTLPLIRGIMQLGIQTDRGLVIAPKSEEYSRQLYRGASKISSETGYTDSASDCPVSVKSGIDQPGIIYLHGDHPLPGPASFFSGRAVINAVRAAPPDMPLLALVSGGTSAMLALPADGLSRECKRAAHESLIHSGSSIAAINLVRRHLSKIKGGGLLRIAMETGRQVIVLALSDVESDAFHDIGAGPFSPDPTSFQEALDVARSIPGFPDAARIVLEEGVAGKRPETLKKSPTLSYQLTQRLLASSKTALDSAEKILLNEGMSYVSFNTTTQSGMLFRRLTTPMKGEPRDWCRNLENLSPGVWYGAAGEAEVRIPPGMTTGRGGRASTILLELGLALSDSGHSYDLAVIATDGSDGNSEKSGGYLASEDLFPPQTRDEARKSILQYDSAGFLDTIHRSFPGAPGETNFGDLLLVRIR